MNKNKMINTKYDFLKNQFYTLHKFQDYIFHYTSPNGLKGILESNAIHFTNACFLNDKNEIIYTYKLIKEILPELKNCINTDLYEQVENRINYVTSGDYLRNETRVT